MTWLWRRLFFRKVLGLRIVDHDERPTVAPEDWSDIDRDTWAGP